MAPFPFGAGEINIPTGNSYETFLAVPVGWNGNYLLNIALVSPGPDYPLPDTEFYWYYLTVW